MIDVVTRFAGAAMAVSLVVCLRLFAHRCWKNVVLRGESAAQHAAAKDNNVNAKFSRNTGIKSGFFALTEKQSDTRATYNCESEEEPFSSDSAAAEMCARGVALAEL